MQFFKGVPIELRINNFSEYLSSENRNVQLMRQSFWYDFLWGPEQGAAQAAYQGY